MLICLEGPDRCGKTTLFNQLREHVQNATFVAGKPHVEELLNVIPRVEQWTEQLWRELYDPRRVYVLDRSFTVTPEVYSQLYGRKLLFDPTPWREQQLVFYVDCSAAQLRARGVDPAFDASRYDEVLSIYDRVLSRYLHWRVDRLSEILTTICGLAPELFR